MLTNGVNILLMLNGANIIHSQYVGISSGNVAFTTQPFQLNANDWIGVACSSAW